MKNMSTKKEEQFLKVPYTILRNKELKDSDKTTLSLIYSFFNNEKEMYMSNNKLGYMLGISRTSASERITKLETLGYIRCDRVMVNGKEKRTIVPLKMVGTPNELVGTPNELVGTPNLLVGTPNGISRSTDTSLVGEPGSIIYPLLLDKVLNKLKENIPDKELYNKKCVEEQLEQINLLIDEDNFINNEERGKAYREQFELNQLLKQISV
jgi:DNA-binding Lrp family transcriptional regulator